MTQDASKPHDIFEAASRLEKERREKEKRKQAPPKQAEPVQDASLAAIFQRCRQMHEEIADSIDQAFKKGGVSPSQLRSYFSRPQNFSAKEWQRIEAERGKNERLLQDLKKRFRAREEESAPLPTVPEKEGAPEKRPPPPSEEKPAEKPPKAPPKEEGGPEAPPPPPEKPPPKKPKIVTRRHWIGM